LTLGKAVASNSALILFPSSLSLFAFTLFPYFYATGWFADLCNSGNDWSAVRTLDESFLSYHSFCPSANFFSVYSAVLVQMNQYIIGVALVFSAGAFSLSLSLSPSSINFDFQTPPPPPYIHVSSSKSLPIEERSYMW
jgi:hypothetical protein